MNKKPSEDKAGPKIATLVNKVGRKRALVPGREVSVGSRESSQRWFQREGSEGGQPRSVKGEDQGVPAGRTPHLR